MNKNYPLHEVKSYESFREIFEDRKNRLPDTALFKWTVKGKDEPDGVTSIQFWNDVMDMGTWMFENGYKEKTFVMLGDTSYEWILAYIAITCGGSVAVPLYKALTATELLYYAKDCDCECIVYSKDYEDTAKEVAGTLNIPLILLDDLLKKRDEGAKLRKSGVNTYTDYDLDPDRLSVIVYTSGTTGRSKGVMLTQRNMALNTAATCRLSDFSGNSVHAIPMHHVFGIALVLLMTVISGETVYINISLRNFFTDMEKGQPRLMVVVPLLMNYIYTFLFKEAERQGIAEKVKKQIEENRRNNLTDAAAKRKMFSSILDKLGGKLEIVLCGGAPLDPEVVSGFDDFGIMALAGYGITECAPVISAARDVFHKPNSVGTIIDICEVKIEDPDAKGCGEICARGPHVMLGYYHMEEETKEAMRGGWFHTGDIGRIDEDGQLYITGRKKNLIILSNGENVSPEELEAKIQAIPLVEEVVVYGQDEMIKAQIYPDQDYLEKNNITDPMALLSEEVEKINKQMPLYKRIEKLSIRKNPFERTSSTKKIIRNIEE